MGIGWRSHLAALLLAGAMLAAGLYPHLLFSREVAELSYFKAAYDEDTYFLWSLSGRDSIFYRWISDHFMAGLAAIDGLGQGRALVLLDALLPPLATLGAYGLAGVLTRRVSARVLIALALVFAPDLLSLGVSSVWQGRWTLDFLRHSFPLAEVLIPDYATSYLAVFRTPEPQWAWALLFLHWAVLLRALSRIQAGEPVGRGIGLGLVASATALAFSYVFVSIPSFMLLCGIALVAVLRRAPPAALALLGASLLLPLLIVLGYQSLHPSPQTGASLVFASRLPALAPSTAWALLLSVAWAMWFNRVRRFDLVGVYAALAGALPLLLLNQQLITGWMVSTRDWERYISYQLLVFSGAVWLSRVLADWSIRYVSTAVCWLAIAWLIKMTVPALPATYAQWRDLNHESLAVSRLLPQLPEPARHLPIVLHKVSLAPLLETRTGHAGPYPGAYGPLFTSPVPDLGGRELQAHLQSLEQKYALYEYLFRTGVTPEQLERSLQAEARARSGYHLAFFFSFVDHWYPASDNRRVRDSDVRSAIPLIVSEYAALRREVPPAWRTPVVRITSGALAPAPGYEHRELASAVSAGVRVAAYLQSYRRLSEAEPDAR